MNFEASLNNGTKVKEGRDGWVEKEGERLPWARLTEYLGKNNLLIDKLKIGNVNLPFESDLFDIESVTPNYYSIQTRMVVDNLLSGPTTTEYLHVTCHYGNFSLHYLIDKATQESWIILGGPHEAIAPSPDRFKED